MSAIPALLAAVIVYLIAALTDSHVLADFALGIAVGGVLFTIFASTQRP